MKLGTTSSRAQAVIDLIPTAMLEAGITPDGYELDVFPLGEGSDIPWLETCDPVWIEQLTTNVKRQGTGRLVMATLCMLADRCERPLALNPWAQPGQNALLQHELEAFYQSLGFGWRRDHVMVREPGVPTVVNVRYDVAYVPGMNRVEFILDGTPPPDPLTKSSFAVPVMDDGSIVMANNRRRGLEVSGGHIEPGETQRDGARRETHEETGAHLDDLVPLGHLRLVSQSRKPKDWKYPHPLSYQSFFAARVTAMDAYTANDECLTPVIVQDDTLLTPLVQIMARRARDLVG